MRKVLVALVVALAASAAGFYLAAIKGYDTFGESRTTAFADARMIAVVIFVGVLIAALWPKKTTRSPQDAEDADREQRQGWRS